ncbi:MAG: glucose 1-dehydrogenase [Acidimicrobiales bacterium]|nr:glucose 1-dehydrogenase [Acidimicrobiales bacterium]
MNEVQRLFSIEGKSAIVTGGSVGIGRMIAEAYVRAGADVTIVSRKQESLDEVVAELSTGGSIRAIAADLSTQEGCAHVAATYAERADSLDILVNNAGATWGAPFDEFPDSAWSRVLDLNVRGVFNLTQALAPALRNAGTAEDPSRVINIGSVDGIRPPDLEGYSYGASKAAVHQLTRHLAKKLGPEHITVNAIAPGPFPSRMMRATIENMGDELPAMTALGRIGEPDDAGAAAIYLASPGARWVTGNILQVDGGVVINA